MFGWLKNILLNKMAKLPSARLLDLINSLIRRHTARLDVKDALKFLMKLDREVYVFESIKGIDYEGGVHPKHRLTKYHDFFISRVPEGATVLDIGCGRGILSRKIAENKHAKITAIDRNSAEIEKAEKMYNHPSVTYKVGDATEEIVRGQYDVIVLSNVLEHIDGRVEFLEKISGMKPDAKYLFRVPVFDRDWRVPLKKELDEEWRLDKTHETEYTVEQFEEELVEAGLELKHREIRWGEIWAEAGVASA